MAGEVATKLFKGGMNKDVDVSLLPEDQYIHAENYKLVAKDGSNNFILENAEGNALWFDATDAELDTSFKLIGSCFINPYLVLFYTDNENDPAPSAGSSAIVRLLLDGDEVLEIKKIYHDSIGAPGNPGNLTFSTTYPISAIGYYEGPDNIKVYWTDGYNPVRTINIMDPNSLTYSSGMLDM